MRALAGLALAGGVALVAALAAAQGAGDKTIPREVLDPSAPDWVLDRLAGNSTAGPQFFQGPAREVGGLHKPYVAPAPDGTVYLGDQGRILSVSPDGAPRPRPAGEAPRPGAGPTEATAPRRRPRSRSSPSPTAPPTRASTSAIARCRPCAGW